MKLVEKIKINIADIFMMTLKIAGSMFSIVCIILAFISCDEIGLDNVWLKLTIMIGMIIVSFIISFILIIFIFKKKVIWKKGKNVVSAQYGDIFQLGFQKNMIN